MKNSPLLRRIIADESGALSLEWVFLVILLTIGLVGGMTAVRDSTIAQFGNIASAAGRLNQSCGYAGCPYLKNESYTDVRATATSIISAE